MLKEIISQVECEQLQALISQSETILCVCHQNPDGDALGASLGWAEVLRTFFGKATQVIVPDQYPDYLHWMPNTDKIIRYDKHKEGCDWTFQHADLIFCLDFNTSSRVGDMQAALDASPAPRVLIDHHLEPDIPSVITISHPEACSTCELVFRLTWQMGAFEQMTKHFAIPVYCGMMTDTGAFTYNSDNCDVYFIISQLLTKHINKDKIYRNVYHNFSEDRLRLMGYVMYQRLVVDSQRHASYFTLTRQDLKRFNFIKGDAEGLVNMPLQIKGHKLSISLREDTEKENTIWVSLRSVDQFPCNEVAARFFNGGGHLNASGGRLYCSMEEAVKIAQQAILAFENQLK
ncbi:DHH family phosphoesterase [Prevotella sp. E9-3]|uniref:DHH family phosphoesterase n=1 Tax=Prevotella sp. E9-3 TaxID=2913621 RepID=UPI001ED9FD05|nr:DHH family phosphoesterase [Prevotella sp. E9-3]UKK47445.1 DHH family phosphoesterase [Prevotella sp. E9-3]